MFIDNVLLNNGVSIDFDMFKEWPVSVLYDRSDPEMCVFINFEEKNGISLNIYTVDGRYADRKGKK